MSSSQIWPCHVTQAKNFSFPYLKSYCQLNFRKSHQISWFCYIPNGRYKADNLKDSRICPLPPMWNRVKLWLFNHKRADFWLPTFGFKRSLLSLLNCLVDMAPHVSLNQPKASHKENSRSSSNRHFDKQQRKHSYRRSSHKSDRLHPMYHPID